MNNQENIADTTSVNQLASSVSASNNALPWDILNTGQNGAKSGIDLNIVPVWNQYNGHGIKVGIFDDGSAVTHTALAAAFSSATVASSNGSGVGQHSTAVAGIIAADGSASPAIGIASGVTAGLVQVVGLNLAGINAGMANLANYDVANNSWGWTLNYYVDQRAAQWQPFFSDIANAADHGRNGLGTVMVVAGGNNGILGGNTELSNFSSDRHVITVAAVTDQGQVANYSNRGASILVAGLSNGGQNGITTTDLPGADGYSSGDTTNSFGGTSAATPEISGITALMLQANAHLGWRDVKDILAMTARHVDGTTVTYNTGNHWNGGGLGFSNDAGFGLVDAAAAVRLAETWTAQSTSANEQNVTANAFSTQGLSPGHEVDYRISLANGVSIETMQINVAGSVPQSSGLEIDLVSPSGTVSTLMNGAGGTSAFSGWTYTSNAFLGEDSGGTWTVRVIDSTSGMAGQLTGVTLSGFGSLDKSHTYYFTDQFGQLSQMVGHNVLADTSGQATLNAAATSADCTINLMPGAVSTIGGGTLTIAQGTVVTTAYAGAGNDVINGNDAGNSLYGGNGNDRISGGNGNDTIHLGLGNNIVNSGAGSDVAILHGSQGQFNVQVQGKALVITNTTSGVTDQFYNTEVVQFNDATIFNVASNSEAAIVNLYEVALNRAPDVAGFQYWLSLFHSGQVSLSSAANSFVNSAEFAADYGSVGNSQFVSVMYENTLDRAPTQSELTGWLAQISSQHLSHADIALAFAELPDAQIKTTGILHVIDGLV